MRCLECGFTHTIRDPEIDSISGARVTRELEDWIYEREGTSTAKTLAEAIGSSLPVVSRIMAAMRARRYGREEQLRRSSERGGSESSV